jgi:hypothetical protein
MQKIIVAGAAALLLSACGGSTRIQESATSIPTRDLTLTPAAGATTQFASKLELGTPAREVRQARAPRASRQGRVARVPDVPVPSEPTPTRVAVAAPAPVAEAPAPPPPDATGRELAPGATVTVIPVSNASGPSGGGTDWSEIPAPREGGVVMVGGGHGGRCQGRGRGPVSILR